MNQQNPTTPYPIVTVVGASGSVGAEVARLAVAYGAIVIGITLDGEPPNDEPWVQGVQWIAADATIAETFSEVGDGPVVVAAPITPPPALLADARRVVWLNPVSIDDVSGPVDNVVQAFVVDIDDSPIDEDFEPSEDQIRVETLAMALLRCALEESVEPELHLEQLQFLGDAVMLQ